MKLTDYPKFTIIMRNYSYEQAEAILVAMKGMEEDFAVEVTLNTPDALMHIEKLNKRFGDKINIGAGTVRTLEDVQAAVAVGAKFLLGPHVFTQDMLQLAKSKGVLSVPAGMTPSEIHQMFQWGADIVKVFPANAVGPVFFKDVQAPLGSLPLMAVGGVSLENTKEFFNFGASYVGIGSGMFVKEDLNDLNVEKLAASMRKFLTAV